MHVRYPNDLCDCGRPIEGSSGESPDVNLNFFCANNCTVVMDDARREDFLRRLLDGSVYWEEVVPERKKIPFKIRWYWRLFRRITDPGRTYEN